jgi:hypothetical protein
VQSDTRRRAIPLSVTLLTQMSHLNHLENQAAALLSAFVSASDSAYYAKLSAEAAALAADKAYWNLTSSEFEAARALQISLHLAAEAADVAKIAAFQSYRETAAELAQEVREIRDLANALARSNFQAARA